MNSGVVMLQSQRQAVADAADAGEIMPPLAASRKRQSHIRLCRIGRACAAAFGVPGTEGYGEIRTVGNGPAGRGNDPLKKIHLVFVWRTHLRFRSVSSR